MRIEVPGAGLVVLVGIAGSGKSTFAARHFARFEVLSSDTFRGMVSDDEADQSATADAFDVLMLVAAKRLAHRRLTVVDATNLVKRDRHELLELARRHGVPALAVALDVGVDEAVRRDGERPGRSVGEAVVRDQHRQFGNALRQLGQERFAAVHTLTGAAQIEAAAVVRTRPAFDRRDVRGPFDAVGDVHGCRSELETLLGRLGYEIERDDAGRAVDARHPGGRLALFLGDLVDRGPDSPGVLRLVKGMCDRGHALLVPGNHDARLVRALEGRSVRRSTGLDLTLQQLDAEPEAFRTEVADWLRGLSPHLILDEGRLVVAHAGLKESLHGQDSGKAKAFALYGDTTGETDERGFPVRLPWQDDYRGAATVLYGHTPALRHGWTNNTLCLDTACVFGGTLTALRYPEREIVAVPAEQVWYEPTKPL